MKKSILIAIAQANTEPWMTIRKEGQEKTWIKVKIDGAKVIHYQSKNAPFLIRKFDYFHEKIRYRRILGLWQGRFDKVITKFISRKIPKYYYDINNQILTVNSWSTYFFFGQRNIALYDWFLKDTDADFLYVTNSSSYINQRNLLRVIEQFNPNETIYAGNIYLTGGSEEFVSGAGKLLSRKSVEVIRDNWHKHSHETLEDVTLGRFMKNMGISAIPLMSVLVPTVDAVGTLSDSNLRSEFHFRCKSEEIPRKDVEIMRLLHDRISTVT